MLNLERLSSSTIRGTFYLLGRRNFIHFVELCIISYPSPLEDAAPWPAKLMLFALAGIFEFMAIHICADLLDVTWRIVPTVFVGLTHGWNTPNKYSIENALTGPDANRVYNSLVCLLLLLPFILRAPSYFRRRFINGKHPSLLSAIVWLNPALFWHVFATILPWILKSDSARMRLLPLFWHVMSPGMAISHSSIILWPGRAAKEIERIKSRSGWELFIYSIRVTTMEQLISRMPRILILITLWIQSRATFWSGRNSKSILRQYHTHFWFLGDYCQKLDSCLSGIFGNFFAVGSAITTRFIRVIASREVLKHSRNGQPLYDTRGSSVSTAEGIRLLCILPSQSESDPIQCALEWHEFTSLPDYEAISYTWGSPTLSRTILVNNKRLEVPQSAYDVLVRARSLWSRQVVWIDAICIDQSSSVDKSAQIPLMHLIYERANRVIVWLGPCDVTSAALATRLIDRLFTINRLEYSWKMDKSLPYEIPPAAASALRKMLARPWFTRAWVVQEVVRARSESHVLVWYGGECLSWERLSWFTQVSQKDSVLLQYLASLCRYQRFASLPAFQNASVMRRFSRLRNDEQPLSLLFYLVQMFRDDRANFDATDPRDRVHALLGLSGSASQDIKPDYAHDLRQCYINAAKHFIQSRPNQRILDFLLHAGISHRSQVPGLPSWVPDWTLKPNCKPLLGMEGASELLNSAAVEELVKDAVQLAIVGDTLVGKGYDSPEEIMLARIQNRREKMIAVLPDATKGTSPLAHVLLNSTILSVAGRHFDRIFVVGDVGLPATRHWKERYGVTGGWACLAAETERSDQQPYGPGGIPAAFLRTIHLEFSDQRLDFTFSSTPEKGISDQDEELAPLTFLSLRSGMWKLDIPGISTELQEMVNQVSPAWEGRAFGVTEGGYFAFFPEGTRKGDIICLLDGLTLPVCLREAKPAPREAYELVGPAYVQGIMNGAAMSLGLKDKNFELI